MLVQLFYWGTNQQIIQRALGAKNLVDTLTRYQKLYGDRFAPCEMLKNMATEGNSFHSN